MNVVRFVRNCDMRLLAGFFLIVAAVYWHGWEISQRAHGGPDRIRTIGSAEADCASRAIRTPFGKLGCANAHGVKETGAATFMPARKPSVRKP